MGDHRARGDGRGSAAVLDARTRALVLIGALVASGAPDQAYVRHVTNALAAGASSEDVVDAAFAVAPTVGLARLVAAIGPLARGLGYDIDARLEDLDRPSPPGDPSGRR